jgi:hypothetical protein
MVKGLGLEERAKGEGFRGSGFGCRFGLGLHSGFYILVEGLARFEGVVCIPACRGAEKQVWGEGLPPPRV